MDVDFSTVNLQYLLRARDCAREDLQRSAVVLGITPALAQLLAQSEPELFGAFPKIQVPLVMLQGAPWWWTRLFEAIRSGRTDELEAVLEHLAVSRLSQEPPG
jgi:hypothetical protein